MTKPFRFIWNLIYRIYVHFDTLPEAVELENSRFYTVSNVAQTLAWMAHLVWFAVLYSLDVKPLAWFQIFSIACYAAAIVTNRHAKHMTSMMISLCEIVLHQCIAVKYLGTDAGFQYFIPVVGIFPFLMPGGSALVKSLLLLLCTGGFLYIELFMVSEQPLYSISKTALTGFNVSNIILSFGFIALWAYFLNIAMYRAEVILRKRTLELAEAEQEKFQREIELRERDNEIYKLRNIELKESYDAILEKNKQIETEKNKSRNLLLNILPEKTAEELMDKGQATSRSYESATVLFSDFVGFTVMAEKMQAEELIRRIDEYFKAFDEIMKKHRLEKIKTIGDAYMAAGGLPTPNHTHATDAIQAAIEMMKAAEEIRQRHKTGFDLRIGIHSGPLVAGVVGHHKFQFDIWGDTVNIAARMEQNSIAGKINISGVTYLLIKDQFHCEYRGKIEAKNKGKIDMYFLDVPASEFQAVIT